MRKNKKKKGFTLIELVIVLAVLAIIALIAIPNFNKVRTDSQRKADEQTGKVIERITLMAIADQDMIIGEKGAVIKIEEGDENSGKAKLSDDDGITFKGEVASDPNLKSTGTSQSDPEGKENYAKALKDVKNPQVKAKKVI